MVSKLNYVLVAVVVTNCMIVPFIVSFVLTSIVTSNCIVLYKLNDHGEVLLFHVENISKVKGIKHFHHKEDISKYASSFVELILVFNYLNRVNLLMNLLIIYISLMIHMWLYF